MSVILVTVNTPVVLVATVVADPNAVVGEDCNVNLLPIAPFTVKVLVCGLVPPALQTVVAPETASVPAAFGATVIVNGVELAWQVTPVPKLATTLK